MQWIEGNNETGFSFNRKVNAVLIHPVAATKIIKLLAVEIFITPVVIELVFLWIVAVVENELVSALLLIAVTVTGDVDSRVADELWWTCVAFSKNTFVVSITNLS